MYHQITLVGNLGRDPEMRYMQDGTPVTTFTVAVTRKVKDSEYTTWYKVECWRKLAEITYQYLKKGKQVLIVASRIEPEAWIDKASGEARAQLKVTADEVKFLGGRDDYATAESGGTASAYQGQKSGYTGPPRTEEDLPF